MRRSALGAGTAAGVAVDFNVHRAELRNWDGYEREVTASARRAGGAVESSRTKPDRAPPTNRAPPAAKDLKTEAAEGVAAFRACFEKSRQMPARVFRARCGASRRHERREKADRRRLLKPGRPRAPTRAGVRDLPGVRGKGQRLHDELAQLQANTGLFGHGSWFGLLVWKLLGFRAEGAAGMQAFRRFQRGMPMPNCAVYACSSRRRRGSGACEWKRPSCEGSPLRPSHLRWSPMNGYRSVFDTRGRSLGACRIAGTSSRPTHHSAVSPETRGCEQCRRRTLIAAPQTEQLS